MINNKDNDEKIVKEYEPLMQHTIGKIPIMLHSNQCILSELDPCDQCATNAFCEVDYDLGTAMCRCPEGMIGYAYGPYGKCGNSL